MDLMQLFYMALFKIGQKIEKSIQLANAVGAMVVQVEGDNEGLPYLEDVEVFLGSRENIER